MATVPISDTSTRNDYVATAGQTVFPYTFWIKDEDHLKVYQNGTLLTKTTHYTVSAVQSVSGANVTLVSGATLNDEIAIVYDPDIERQTEFQTSGNFKATDINVELTYLTSLLQYHDTILGRTLRLSDSDSGSVLTISGSLTADTLLQVNSGGTAIESSTLSAGDLSSLGAISADITTVAGIAANVTTVAGISANVTTVAGISSNVTAVAGNASNINTVAADLAGSDDIGTVAANIADVGTVADNIAGVNSFAERYRVGATDPVSDNDEGDLFYNTTSDLLKRYNGSSWAAITSGITSLVEDTTPQLGGNLDVNGQSIVSVSNGDITLAPNGSGTIVASSKRITSVADPTSAQDAATKAYVDASGSNTLPNNGHAANRYNFGGIRNPSSSTAAVSANVLYAYPFYVGKAETFTRIGAEVTTGSAGNARLGIYNMADGAPTTLVADCGTISTGTTGVKEVTISQALSSGLYALAIVFDATPTMRQAGFTSSLMAHVMGVADVAVDSAPRQMTVAHTYGALPASYGTPTYSTATINTAMWLREV